MHALCLSHVQLGKCVKLVHLAKWCSHVLPLLIYLQPLLCHMTCTKTPRMTINLTTAGCGISAGTSLAFSGEVFATTSSSVGLRCLTLTSLLVLLCGPPHQMLIFSNKWRRPYNTPFILHCLPHLGLRLSSLPLRTLSYQTHFPLSMCPLEPRTTSSLPLPVLQLSGGFVRITTSLPHRYLHILIGDFTDK